MYTMALLNPRGARHPSTMIGSEGVLPLEGQLHRGVPVTGGTKGAKDIYLCSYCVHEMVVPAKHQLDNRTARNIVFHQSLSRSSAPAWPGLSREQPYCY
jgi:hypothetical protein